MTTVGAFAAKTHFSELLQKARNGEEITITYHGEPVVQMIPCSHSKSERHKREEIIQKIKEIGERNSLGNNTSLKELVTEGRK